MNIKDYRVQNLINYVPNNNRSLILIINYYSIFVSYNLLKCKYVMIMIIRPLLLLQNPFHRYYQNTSTIGNNINENISY